MSKSYKLDIQDESNNVNLKKSPSAQAQELRVFIWDLGVFPKWTQFAICVSGIFVFYLFYGYFQELIFRLDGFKKHGWYLTLIQFALYSIFGFTEMKMMTTSPRRIPMETYALIAFLTVATMGLSNASLGYLNYPTQVIFKCCKLIPVMIGGIFIQGKKYTSVDFLACLSMSVGLTWFILADSQVSPNFDSTGVLLISMALCADAVIGNVQEKAMKQYESTNTEMVFFSYSIGFIYIFIGLLLSNGLKEAFLFCSKYPLKTYGYATVFSFSGYLGITFVLTLIRAFGALPAVTVTTCRKAVSIILSFLVFEKPFTVQYILSGVVVLFGITLNIYNKNQKKINSVFASLKWQRFGRLHFYRKEKISTQIV